MRWFRELAFYSWYDSIKGSGPGLEGMKKGQEWAYSCFCAQGSKAATSEEAACVVEGLQEI